MSGVGWGDFDESEAMKLPGPLRNLLWNPCSAILGNSMWEQHTSQDTTDVAARVMQRKKRRDINREFWRAKNAPAVRG